MGPLLVIGLVFELSVGLAAIGMMIPGLLPPKPADPSRITTVRIGVGQYGLGNETDAIGFAGDFPDVLLYDGAGRYVGRNGGKGQRPHLDAGGFKEVAISHEDGMHGVGSEYMALAASGDDAICINFITMTWPSGVQFGFLGDVGYLCGANWHYSDTAVLNTDSSTLETPVMLNRTSTCVWLDRNYSYDLKFQGMGIHMIDFSSSKDIKEDGRAKQYHFKKESMCSSAPRFKMYEKMTTYDRIPIFWPKLQYNADNTDANLSRVINDPGYYVEVKEDETPIWIYGNKKRDSAERPVPRKRSSLPNIHHTLIKSARIEHSAMFLCDSPASWGPDLVSVHEGLFCDMDTKTIWPLCLTPDDHSCFDVAKNDLLPGPKGRRDLNGTPIPQKAYSKEVKWGGME